MLYKHTTNELMERFDSAISNISVLQKDIDAAKTAVKSRLKILDAQCEYLLQSAEILKDVSNTTSNKIVFASDSILDGLYDSFGVTVHPKFKRTPSNILNFKTTTGYLFKNNISVMVSEDEEEEVEDVDYIEMFKHDSIDSKGYIIKEYDEPTLSFTVSMQDDKSLGNVNFNIVEILPYLSGSFDMTISFYERGSEYPNGNYTQRLRNVAASRIVLPDKIALSKVKFDIQLKYKNSNNKYVFGLKHLYFMNASMDEEDSYVVVKITKPSNISYLYKDILLKTQEGVYLGYTLDDFNIEAYANYDSDNNVLSRSIEASTQTDPRYISINLNTLYFKIPVHTSIISFVPSIETD